MRILMLCDELSPNFQAWKEGLEKYGGATVKLWSMHHVKTELLRLLLLPSFKRNLVAAIKSFQPDIMIAGRYTSYGFIGALSGFHPFVVAGQGASDVWHAAKLISFREMMARTTFKHADFVQAWAQHMTKAMIKYGADENKILVLPRGVDREVFYPPEDISEVLATTLTMTRSLFPEYRHEVVLNAIARLKLREIKVTLNIIGDGPLRSKLVQNVAALNIIDVVNWHGKQPLPKVADILRESGIYVSMPNTEGLSASLLEAMACGCYPIVSDLPANRELIVDRVNGRLVSVDNVNGLTDAISEAIADDEGRKRAFDHNQNFIENHGSLERNMKRFVIEYERLIVNNLNRKGG